MDDLIDDISLALDDNTPERQIPTHLRLRQTSDFPSHAHLIQKHSSQGLDEFDRQLLQDTLPVYHPVSQPSCQPQSQQFPQSPSQSGHHGGSRGYNASKNQEFCGIESLARRNRWQQYTSQQIPRKSKPKSLIAKFGFQQNSSSTPPVTEDDDASQHGFSSPTPAGPSQSLSWTDLEYKTSPNAEQPHQLKLQQTHQEQQSLTRGIDIPFQNRTQLEQKYATDKKAHRPVVHGIQLVPVDLLPDRFHFVFPYPLFNAVQSRCYDPVYNTFDNLVVSAPTGSGKTVILELSICSLLRTLGKGTYKVIYLAPTKALCSERRRDWEKKFRNVGLTCTELTGDTDLAQIANVRKGDLIVTTPEKWDSMTRRWEDHHKLLDLIDEVHILKESRGATLEVVVSRMKSIGSNVRFIALSATIPNAGDIAVWLGKDAEHSQIPAHLEVFGPEFRPVRLEKHVYGYQSYANDFAFDKTLDQKLPGLLQKHAAGKPALIFCMTRNISVSTAKLIADHWTRTSTSQRPWFGPRNRLQFKDKDLQAIAACGVAYHHAGLELSDRNLIESEYLTGGLMVICCTSTLAVGINLPAHLVVIKNTVCWTDRGTKEYADLEIMQMLGRAGRPQFDNAGVAVIMTRKENIEKFERMESGMEILESCLHKNLIEHMNAEIGLKTITDSWSAQQWLRSTFLHVRLMKNPGYYKLEGTSAIQGSQKRLEDICERDIALLVNERLVERINAQLKCTKYGESMAKYYIRFGTMIKILKMKGSPRVPDILMTLVEAEEFTDLRFRSGEKSLYKELNKGNDIRYPLKQELVTPAHKSYVLLQFELGSQDFPLDQTHQKLKASMNQDKVAIFKHVYRIIYCILDCLIDKEDAVGVNNGLELARSLKAKVWEGSAHELRQIEGLGPVAVRKLVSVGVKSLKTLETMAPHRIELTLSRNPPFGTQILKSVQSIPRFTLKLNRVGNLEYSRGSVLMKLRVNLGYLNATPPIRFRGIIIYGTFVAMRSDGYLLSFKKLPVHQLEGGKDIKFAVNITEPGQGINCFLACEQIVGTMVVAEYFPDINSGFKFPFNKQDKSGPAQRILLPHALGKEQLRDLQQRPLSLHTSVSDSAIEDDYDGSDDVYLTQIVEPEPVDDTSSANIARNAPNRKRSFDNCVYDLEPTETVEDGTQSEEWNQLPNGNWKCRHKCGDKTKCRHICCREGLDRPPKRLKENAASMITVVTSAPIRRKSSGLLIGSGSQLPFQGLKVNQHRQPPLNAPEKKLFKKKKVIRTLDLTDDVSERNILSGSFTKLWKLHGRNVPTRPTVKRLPGMFGSGFFGRSKPADDHDQDLPSLDDIIASTSSNAIKAGLVKTFGQMQTMGKAKNTVPLKATGIQSTDPLQGKVNRASNQCGKAPAVGHPDEPSTPNLSSKASMETSSFNMAGTSPLFPPELTFDSSPFRDSMLLSEHREQRDITSGQKTWTSSGHANRDVNSQGEMNETLQPRILDMSSVVDFLGDCVLFEDVSDMKVA